MNDYLQPEKATSWCERRKLPAIGRDIQHELVRIALAVEQAIHADENAPPPEIRVYFQALKYIASVAGAPEGKKWYGVG